MAYAQVEPAQTTKTLAELNAIAGDLVTKEVSADEFAKSQRALVDVEVKQQQQNAYWLIYLAGAQTDGRRLQYAAQAVANLKSLTPADIQAAARRWLRKERSWQLMILPRTQ